MRGEIRVSWKNLAMRGNVITAERLCHLLIDTFKKLQLVRIYENTTQNVAVQLQGLVMLASMAPGGCFRSELSRRFKSMGLNRPLKSTKDFLTFRRY